MRKRELGKGKDKEMKIRCKMKTMGGADCAPSRKKWREIHWLEMSIVHVEHA